MSRAASLLGRLAATMAALSLAACASAAPLQTWSPPAGASALSQSGPWRVVEADISREVDAARGDCQAVVERYSPQGDTPPARTPLVFAHGFLRDVAQHREHARHWASWGVPVYLVGHCSGGWTRPVEGVAGGGAGVLAGFMRQVADASGAPSVVYGGFSAGGRASRMAAWGDARTVGWLGLDPVDRLPRDTPTAPFPMAALFAPPQSCNAQQVGRGLTRAAVDGRALEVQGSTHCHFEWPSNVLCRAACGEPGSEEHNTELRRRISTLALAFVRWRVGLDAQPPDAMWADTPGLWVQPAP